MTRPIRLSLVIALAVLFGNLVSARLASAQNFTTAAIATATLVDQGPAESLQASPRPAPVTFAPSPRPISFLMQSLYVSTAVIQGLDAQSTFKALDAGAVEGNSLVKPFASNRPAFIALKAGMAAAFIYAGHDLSKRHKVGAILALGLVNSLYTAIALHNYHVVQVMDARR